VPTEIFPPQTVESALAWWDSRRCEKLGIALHETEGGGASFAERAEHFAAGIIARRGRGGDSVPPLAAIVVGTEGGMTGGEREQFLRAGFFQAHFATNILRVDTAALYGMAALQTALMGVVG
jgi:16S rRNA (uracil1498-N3)-methyltransferase